MVNCYYKILGVPFRASQEEIKRAFRVLALRWHPDRNPGNPRAAEHFRRVLEAYESLINDSEKRRQRKSGGNERFDRNAQGFEDCSEKGPFSSLDEILQDAFGLSFERREGRRGVDLRFDVQIPKSATIKGIHEDIVYHRLVFCRKCSGVKGLMSRSLCDLCLGNGELEEHCTLRIWIPPGSDNGTRLKFSGQGDHPAPGTPPGDLVVFIYVVDGA